MAKGIKTQHTELYFVNNDSAPALVKVGAFTDFNGLGGQKGEIDATNLDSTAKEFFTGLEDSGTFGANINLDPSDSGHQDMIQVKDDGTNNSFILCLSDGSAAPTLTGSTITPPAGRTSVAFTASVQQFTISGAADAIVKAAIQLRITGSVAWSWKA